MEPNFHGGEEFERNMKKLVHVLQKILKSYKVDGQDLGQIFEKKNMNLNLCFFTFLPVGQEDLEEMESAFEEYLERGEKKSDLQFELNSRDVAFLKRHGIKF